MTTDTLVGRHLAACPTCGGRIQATVKIDLDDLVIEQNEDGGEIVGYRDRDRRNEPITLDLADVEFERISIYCENDCDLDDLLAPLAASPRELRSGDRVTIRSSLNDGRYNGRVGTVGRVSKSAGRLIVQLDDWTPGLEPPDGKLYLSLGEVVREQVAA